MKYVEHTGHPGQYSLVTEGVLLRAFFNQELLLCGGSHNVATARNGLKTCKTYFDLLAASGLIFQPWGTQCYLEQHWRIQHKLIHPECEWEKSQENIVRAWRSWYSLFVFYVYSCVGCQVHRGQKLQLLCQTDWTELNWTELTWTELNWTEERMVNRVRMLLCYDYINGRAAWGLLYNCFWTGARSLQTLLEKPCKARAHIQLDLAMEHAADWNPSAPRRQPGAEPSRCEDLLEPKPIVCWCQKATITAPLVPNPIFCGSEWQQLLCYCRSL